MLYWVREIAGWLLVVVALLMIRQGIVFIGDSEAPRIVEAGMILFAATGVMRIGVTLIRVATAARIVHNEGDHMLSAETDASSLADAR